LVLVLATEAAVEVTVAVAAVVTVAVAVVVTAGSMVLAGGTLVVAVAVATGAGTGALGLCVGEIPAGLGAKAGLGGSEGFSGELVTVAPLAASLPPAFSNKASEVAAAEVDRGLATIICKEKMALSTYAYFYPPERLTLIVPPAFFNTMAAVS
jgi:hypothetical protein